MSSLSCSLERISGGTFWRWSCLHRWRWTTNLGWHRRQRWSFRRGLWRQRRGSTVGLLIGPGNRRRRWRERRFPVTTILSSLLHGSYLLLRFLLDAQRVQRFIQLVRNVGRHSWVGPNIFVIFHTLPAGRPVIRGYRIRTTRVPQFTTLDRAIARSLRYLALDGPLRRQRFVLQPRQLRYLWTGLLLLRRRRQWLLLLSIVSGTR